MSDPKNSNTEMRIPFHTVSKTPAPKQASEDGLPLGVLAHGGRALRKEGWTGEGIRIAVIDSGIDETHPRFDGKVTRKKWYRDGTPLASDDGLHGTHVAGTIHFMAPDAELYDYRVFGKDGATDVNSAIAEAIRDAVDSNCQLINMSLGGPFSIEGIGDAVKYAAQKGVIMICAAGNEGDQRWWTNENSYPANYPECISIAAVAKRGDFRVAWFSNSNPEVDYAGIGVQVTSLYPGGTTIDLNGTSMACPHVCGLAACLLQKHAKTVGGSMKTPTDKELREILTKSHAIDIAARGKDSETGVGFVSYLKRNEVEGLLPAVGNVSDTDDTECAIS